FLGEGRGACQQGQGGSGESEGGQVHGRSEPFRPEGEMLPCESGHFARFFLCRRASPAVIATEIARSSERAPGIIGIRSRASAASCTVSGTPDDSRPKSRMSFSWNW